MTGQPPHNFQYHEYLKKILGTDKQGTSLFIATEKDFGKGNKLEFPYRSYFYVFGLFHEGNRKMKIGTNEYDLKAKTLTMVGPGIVRHWKDSNWSPSCHYFKPQTLECLIDSQAFVFQHPLSISSYFDGFYLRIGRFYLNFIFLNHKRLIIKPIVKRL
jgi:hypothetical protein